MVEEARNQTLTRKVLETKKGTNKIYRNQRRLLLAAMEASKGWQ